MRLEHEIVTVQTRTPFVIARGGASEWRLVWVRIIDDDGAEGWGEAAPSRFYGETTETVIAVLDRLAAVLHGMHAWSLEAIEAEMHRVIRFNASAKSAVSAALHDLAAKRLGVPLHRMLGLDPARAPQSSFTIAIAENEVLERRVSEARDYPILKIKLGTDRDMEIVRIVRNAAPQKRLRVDANAAWTAKHAVEMSDFLAEQGVEMLEQPLPANDVDGLRFVRERSRLPVFADESCLVKTAPWCSR